MAAPEKVKNKDRSTSYKIYVNYKGKRENKRFSTRQLAIDWAAKRKTELESEEIYGKNNSNDKRNFGGLSKNSGYRKNQWMLIQGCFVSFTALVL